MTGINWLWLVIGVLLGAGGQRLLSPRPRQRTMAAAVPPPQIGTGNSGTETEPGTEPGTETETEAELEPAVAIATAGAAKDNYWLDYLRALERSQFQGGFLARTAHELRSPLSSLMGLQQLILTDLCDDAEEERQCVAQSYEAAQNLNGLMDQLVRVSRLEQGSQRLDIQPLALNVLLEDLESYVHLQVADRNSRLILDVPAQSIYLQADYNSLRQALVILVELALGQKAREIRLELRAEEDFLKLILGADQPWVPLQEQLGELAGGNGPSNSSPPDSSSNNQRHSDWNHEALGQLKQSLAQQPGKAFVPHRLSPGMALLLAQLILEWNGGRLALGEQRETETGEAGSYSLECWLRAA
jgi:hypothetical protein